MLDRATEMFDYIIVGAGSAGAALAHRLSADSSRSVLLLEAGAKDRKQEIHIPAAFSKLFRSSYDWNYDTVPQPELGGRTIYWPRGKMLGGSSSLNAMMWVSGFAADYDRWATAAGPTWSWSSLQPYFRQVQRSAADSTSPASSGAVSIEAQRSPRAATASFLDAVRQTGLPVEEANGPQPTGFTQTMVSQHRGARFSAADAYLKPARRRRNLLVRTGTAVHRVVFDGRRAIGVEVAASGGVQRIDARREVVLCGGAVNTPQLLMLSGIGDPAQLKTLGIPVVTASPEVGANLADHLIAGLVTQARQDTLFDAERPAQIARYLLRRRGMLTSNVAEAYGFVRTRPKLPLADIEILFAPVAYLGEGLVKPPGHGLTIGAILLQPKSSGRIALASADPGAKPLIDPRYLSDPDGDDRATLMAGLEILREDPARPGARRARHGPLPRPGRRADDVRA